MKEGLHCMCVLTCIYLICVLTSVVPLEVLLVPHADLIMCLMEAPLSPVGKEEIPRLGGHCRVKRES